MAQNYVLLERIELNAAASSVTFSNIPQTNYTDLKIVLSLRGTKTGTGEGLYMAINGLSTNRFWRWLYGSGSASGTGTGSDSMIGNMTASSATASTFSNIEVYIPNYTSSEYKSITVTGVDENNATSAFSEMLASQWASTAAITSLTFTPEANNFDTYCTFSLYGIANSATTPTVAPKADGGNVIATDGTYWYHAFLSNGTFTPQANLTADLLVVGGGGGGGFYYGGGGGGGGAGGLVALTAQSLASGTGYACTIGAGGTTNTSLQNINGSNGGDSQIGSFTAAVGGGGGGTPNSSGGSNGGSGGGGGSSSADRPGGTGTSGQGNNGGSGTGVNLSGGGGGGGAGAAGVNGTGTVAGNGGAGLNTYSSWATATATGVSGYYAGGGGAGIYVGGGGTSGTGGSGGGGNAGVTATANSGGGGGGAYYTSTTVLAGLGGSGIIIIRYPIAS